MKWIRLFESFDLDKKIDAVNYIFGTWVLTKFFKRLKRIEGTREEHYISGSHLIKETYYYKIVKGKPELMICIVEGGLNVVTTSKGSKMDVTTIKNVKTVCINKPYKGEAMSIIKLYLPVTAMRYSFSYFNTIFNLAFSEVSRVNISFLPATDTPLKNASINNFKKIMSSNEMD